MKVELKNLLLFTFQFIPDCPKSSSYQKSDLSALPLMCSITSKCTEIHCCLSVSPIGRSFEVFIDLDPCYNTLKLGVEAYTAKISLRKYEFGKLKLNSISQSVKIRF